VTGYVLASLVFFGGILIAVLGELVNEEIRGWLDYLPQVVLRLAARRLDPVGRITIYEDEWLPELICILRGAEARPISRLIIGIKYSAWFLIKAKRIARHLHRTSPGLAPLAAAPAAVMASASSQFDLLTDRMEEVGMWRTVISQRIHDVRAALDCAERFLASPQEAAYHAGAIRAARRDRDCHLSALASLNEELAVTEQVLCSLAEMREEGQYW
jgi:hypothetical protein